MNDRNFTASNGVVVHPYTDGVINVGGDHMPRNHVEALLEFFAHAAKLNTPKPWVMAKEGEVWVLFEKKDTNGIPWVRLQTGEWRSCDRYYHPRVVPSDFFVYGYPLWRASI